MLQYRDKVEAGTVVGKLTVVSEAEPGAKGGKQWLCKCECGNELLVLEKTILTRKWLSCGCEGTAKTEDLTGQKFGRLLVLGRTTNAPDGKSRWICLCDCGNNYITTAKRLKNASFPPSCGCLPIENARI